MAVEENYRVEAAETAEEQSQIAETDTNKSAAKPKTRRVYRFFKRAIDVILSACGIVVLALPMLIVAIIIKIDSPGPVFFKQKRVGLHKKHFTILKFRSMPVDVPRDTPTHQLKNADAMLSKWQHFIRRSSIDELPQIFNIFTGKMSIIGERGIIEATKKNIDFSRVVAVNSVSL